MFAEMADPSKSRGRARGRARAVDQPAQSRPGGPTPVQAPPPQGAWGPRPGGSGPRLQEAVSFVKMLY